MHRYRELLTSFLASAMFTTAMVPVPGTLSSLAGIVDPAAARRAVSMVLAHAPAGYEGASAAAVSPTLVAATVPAAAPAPAITRERIAEIAAFTRAHGGESPIGPRTGVPLGLFAAGETYISLQTAFDTANPARTHYWAVHKGASPKILVLARQATEADLWVFDLDGNLLSAGLIRNRQFTLLTPDQARASFEAEMRIWASHQLVPPAPVTTAASAPGA